MDKNIKILLCGPFIGNFFNEITMFRPFFYWLKEDSKNVKTYVCSELNRGFLYKNENFISYNEILDEKITDLEKINKKTIVKIKKNIRNIIAKIDNVQIKEIELITFPQNSDLQIIEDYKIHKKITENNVNKLYDILFIFKDDDTINRYKEKLSDLNITYIKEDENFEEIYNKLIRSKICLTYIQSWAFVSNLQNIPLLYWGTDVSRFKNDGIWSFNNTKDKLIFPIKIENSEFFFDVICKQVKNFVNKR